MFTRAKTVSGVHARIEKAEKSLVITDLDSTNGTFIDQRRLKPGVPAFAVPGSRITFGIFFSVPILFAFSDSEMSGVVDKFDSYKIIRIFS